MQKMISIRRLAVLILILAACLLMIGGGSSADRPTTQKTLSPEGWTVESVPPETIVKSLVKLTAVNATILADKGTSDGDKEEIQWMLDVRRGIRIQLQRMLPYFENLAHDLHLANKAFQVTAVRFATLKSVAECLPKDSDDGTPLSTAFRCGLADGKNLMLRHCVSKLEEALDGEKLETWYDRLGEKHQYSPEQNFRIKFEKVHDYFMTLVNKF